MLETIGYNCLAWPGHGLDDMSAYQFLEREVTTPFFFWEGDCESRLEVVADIPSRKAVYRFEKTNLFKAKEILGDVVCLQGNVPLSMLVAGTPDDVKDYCKKLIDVVEKGGGFILSPISQFSYCKAGECEGHI